MDDASIVLTRLLGDLLSPPRCAACSSVLSERQVFCAACASTVERSAPWEGGIAFGYYGGALQTAIQRLKYEDSPHLAGPLGDLLRSACRPHDLHVDAVVPVPLHPRRLVERGYNQAALLARHVAKELAAPFFVGVLRRAVDTSPQVGLSAEQRVANVASAFLVQKRSRIRGRTIVVVDDVATTGSTLASCRNTLIEGGARRVIGVVVARTSSSGLEVSAKLDVDTPQKSGVAAAARVQDAPTSRSALIFRN